jgi:hypothetical protein
VLGCTCLHGSVYENSSIIYAGQTVGGGNSRTEPLEKIRKYAISICLYCMNGEPCN